MINPELDRLALARYVSVMTFHSDGTGVAASVWVASEGGYLQVLSRTGDGLVKRLRRDPRITVAPCDARGNLQGDPVTATAAVIEDPELVARVEGLIRVRYGLAARIMQVLQWVRKRAVQPVVVAIEVPSEAAG